MHYVSTQEKSQADFRMIRILLHIQIIYSLNGTYFILSKIQTTYEPFEIDLKFFKNPYIESMLNSKFQQNEIWTVARSGQVLLWANHMTIRNLHICSIPIASFLAPYEVDTIIIYCQNQFLLVHNGLHNFSTVDCHKTLL